jgi:hypothetical protein
MILHKFIKQNLRSLIYKNSLMVLNVYSNLMITQTIYNNITTVGGGLAVKSVVPSGLRCGGFRFESRNGKRPR